MYLTKAIKNQRGKTWEKGEAIKEDEKSNYGERKHVTVPEYRWPLHKKRRRNEMKRHYLARMALLHQKHAMNRSHQTHAQI